MSKGMIKVSDELYNYILSVSLREPDILRRLREETEPYPHSIHADFTGPGPVYGAAGPFDLAQPGP